MMAVNRVAFKVGNKLLGPFFLGGPSSGVDLANSDSANRK